MVVYPEISVTNDRGQTIEMADMDHPVTIRVTVSADRPSDAELTGNVQNKIMRVLTRDAPVDSWALIVFRGEEWDLARPPHPSRFTRSSGHVEFLIRSRNAQVDV
jgi:hypothetical protein